LRDDDDIDDLEYDMMHLKVGEILKIQSPKNPSARYSYELRTDTDVFQISGPEYIENDSGFLGAEGANEYTLKVVKAGKG